MKKKESNGISVILPVHELNDDVKKYLPNAIGSVLNQKVRPDNLIIVVPENSEILNYVKSYDFGDYTKSVIIAENSGSVDFASQINYGVSVSNTEWFSILEFDDEYANIWFKNVVTYKNAHTNVGIFMPIIVDVNTESAFMGLTNEAVWANSFSDELGILDLNALLDYQNFSIDGIVMKKSIFEEFGKFKTKIKLTFIYEFLLRMTYKDVKTMVIPKFGYKHVNQRSGSLFYQYKESMNAVEAKWWLSAAKREYYFPTDRDITYQD